MERDKLFDVLRRGYPLAYDLKSLGYRYAGLAVYRECTEKEIELFHAFNQEMKKIDEIHDTLNEDDVSRLLDVFHNIIKNGEIEFDQKKVKPAQDQLQKDMETLSLNELDDIAQQHEVYIKAYDFDDGAFYRHPYEDA